MGVASFFAASALFFSHFSPHADIPIKKSTDMTKKRIATLPAALLFLLLTAVFAQAEWLDTPFDNGTLHYLDTGPADGAPLLFIHDWSCNATFWNAQTDAFAETHRVIALDLPGFGKSSKPHGIAYTPGYFARAVRTVMQAARIEQPVLIGHGMGYRVARHFLIEYPGEVRALVNVDGEWPCHTDTTGQGKIFDSTPGEILARLEGPEHDAAVSEYIERSFCGKTPTVIQRRVRQVMANTAPHSAGSALREMLRPDRQAPYTGDTATAENSMNVIDVPCLAVYAQHDLTAPEQENRLRARFTTLFYVEWDDVGHYLMLQHAARFNDTVRRFLSGLPAQR